MAMNNDPMSFEEQAEVLLGVVLALGYVYSLVDLIISRRTNSHTVRNLYLQRRTYARDIPTGRPTLVQRGCVRSSWASTLPLLRRWGTTQFSTFNDMTRAWMPTTITSFVTKPLRGRDEHYATT